MAKVLDGLRDGRKPRQIARDIWGVARVEAEWHADGWMRSQVRRWIAKAEAMAEGGWRELVPRYGSEE